MYYLALDIGGTKTSGALFTTDGKIVNNDILVTKSKTFDGEESVYLNSRSVLDRLMERNHLSIRDIIAIGVGAPGPLDSASGTILHAPLMGWHHFPLLKRLACDYPVPAALDNDGNLGALAEQRVGLGKGLRNVAYMTVSTGIGGGMILDGKLYKGSNDGAGEFGHMSIFPDGLECPCGNTGCLELYASGTAIARRLRDDFQNHAGEAFFQDVQSESELTCKRLEEFARKGNRYAQNCLREEGRYLGIGISNIFNLLDLDMLVIGGGVSKAHQLFEEAMFQTIEERCIQPFRREQIRFSEMNDRVVLFGAYQMVHNM